MSIIAVTFARMNPPTTGHELLVNVLKKYAPRNINKKCISIERRIYLSSSHDTKNNPLDFQTKFDLVKRAFEDIDAVVSEIQCKDVFDMVRWVSQLGHPDLAVIVGGDRYDELSKRLPMYNGTEYKFRSIRVINAGDRDNSDTVAGMSASKMREAAKLGDYETFERGLPNKLRSMSQDIYQRVREACLTKESLK